MNIETTIKLNLFKPRPYQIPLFDAIENKRYKRALLIWHRRAGKDMAAFNLMVRQAFKRIGAYYYILPTYKQARLTLFEGKTSDGKAFLDYIPQELVRAINKNEQKIELINGSFIYFLGSDNYDSLRGSNPVGIVFSEYAYQHPQVYPTVRPILVHNRGWSIFISTPFGENHFFTLYEVARNSPEWFTDVLTVDDTGLVSQEEIAREIKEGIMSPDMVEQEYYCSFSVGALGSYYAKYLVQMELKDQIGQVPWEAGFKVHTCWDLGMRDYTTILFYQCIGQTIRIIDMYQNSDVGLEHYINVLQSKPYTYGKHIAPHDIRVRDYTGGGLSRWDKAKNLGITFTLAPDMTIIDGIESVRTTLQKIWIDKEKCGPLLRALRDYRKEYDATKKVYRNNPLHDHNSHTADALRYLCVSLPKTRDGLSPEELDKRYREAYLGENNNMPSIFRTDLPEY